MRVRAVRPAIREARDIRKWYRQRNPKAARDFQSEYLAVRERIARWPLAGVELGGGLRAMRFSSFPYSVIYRVGPAVVEVVAVAHAKREPGYWLRR